MWDRAGSSRMKPTFGLGPRVCTWKLACSLMFVALLKQRSKRELGGSLAWSRTCRRQAKSPRAWNGWGGVVRTGFRCPYAILAKLVRRFPDPRRVERARSEVTWWEINTQVKGECKRMSIRETNAHSQATKDPKEIFQSVSWSWTF